MTDINKLLEGARNGRIADIARLLSIVENEEPQAAEVVKATYAQTGRATLVGFTGPPGSGKSTLVATLTDAYRKSGARVAVVAVDPSSPYTGGAILGDRIRMREQSLDPGVFIRSMSNRGRSGGLARATRRLVGILDALGFDVVLVETVGAGQQEVEVARVVDTVCLLTIPGAGDDVQAIKAGIIEIADILVVNKGDRPGADAAVKDLMQMLNLGTPRTSWRTPIIRTSATGGTGIQELMAVIQQHRVWAEGSGAARQRNLEAMRNEIQTLMQERALRDLANRLDNSALEAVVTSSSSLPVRSPMRP